MSNFNFYSFLEENGYQKDTIREANGTTFCTNYKNLQRIFGTPLRSISIKQPQEHRPRMDWCLNRFFNLPLMKMRTFF